MEEPEDIRLGVFWPMGLSVPLGHRQTMGSSLPPLRAVTSEKEEAERATSLKFVYVGSEWGRRHRSQ